MQKSMCIFWVVMFVVLVACGCGTIYENTPVGIGTEYSELKKSPCACLELKKAPVLPEQFS